MKELVARLEGVYGTDELRPRYDPVEELICCILTQHTTDATAFPAFDKLRTTFPTWQQVVDAGPVRIAGIIRNVGLANQKSRSIVRSLEQIHSTVGAYSLEHLREMPMLAAREWLMTLPGVGPKTASIVLSFALGMNAIPVDTHVYRVSWRLGLIAQGVGEAKAHDLLLSRVPDDLAYRFHVALIQHGRRTCKAPLPNCSRCAVTSLCLYFRNGGATRLDGSRA